MENQEIETKEPEVKVVKEKNTLEELKSERAGSFDVNVTYSELKYVRNTLNKVEWTGQNEAYLLLITLAALNDALSTLDQSSIAKSKVSLPAASIESINFFLSRVSGKGPDHAQKLFSSAMVFRPALEKMKELDLKIKSEV